MKLRFFGLVISLVTVFSSFGQGLTYDKVRTKLTVFRNGDLQVDEVYDVIFTEPMHGIYVNRTVKNTIPLTPKKHALGKLENFVFPYEYTKKLGFKMNHVSEQYTIEENSGLWQIRLGDADRFVEGEKQYALSYTIKNALIKGDSTIMVYWNLIGADHEVEYSRVETEIVLADGLEGDVLDVEFYKGLTNSTDTVKFSRAGDRFTLNTIGLDANEALTMMLHLKPTAISGVETGNTQIRYFWVLIPLLIGLFYFTRKKKYGQQARLTEMVQYYPPKDVDSALVGVIANKYRYIDAISSLLLYWGWKGNVRLEERNFKKPKPQIKYALYVGIALLFPIILISILFPEAEVGAALGIGVAAAFITFLVILIINKSRVAKSQLVVIKLKDLEEDAPDYEKRWFNLLFKDKSEFDFTFFKAKKSITGRNAELEGFAMEFKYITEDLMRSYESKVINQESKKTMNKMIVSIVLMGLVGSFIATVYFGLFPTLVIIGLSIYLAVESRKFTFFSQAGSDLVRDSLGFKHFIKTSQKEKLEFLVKENPDYYSETLAFALAYGLADIWSDKLKDLAQIPSWYGVPPGVVPTAAMVHQSMQSIVYTQTVSYQTKSSTGGGFTGGSAGGGVGGGGSGGW